MKMRLFLLLVILVCAAAALRAQPKITVLQSGKRVSLRGLSVVTDKIVWASGSSGTVARSTDGGNNWEWMTVPGYEKRDFRDIEAFDADTAIIMAIASPAVLLKTSDGGKHWRKVYEDTASGVFLDAMAFNPHGATGTVIGDPLPGAPWVYQLYTYDHGDTWTKNENLAGYPQAHLKEGEAFFASSGTNVAMMGNHPLLVSGGKAARIFAAKWDSLPMIQGGESTGANSVAVFGTDRYTHGIVVGGDFARDTLRAGNCLLFQLDRGMPRKIRAPRSGPNGYRSCVIYLTKNTLLTCGTSGVDISNNGGNNWTLVTREGFHVCQKANNGKAVFLAGGNGRIARLEQ